MDYKHLRAWNRMMGSHEHWNRASLEKARQDKAPSDAIYNDAGIGNGGQWQRFADCTNVETQMVINRYVAELEKAEAAEARRKARGY